jgi:hypothetical protein
LSVIEWTVSSVEAHKIRCNLSPTHLSDGRPMPGVSQHALLTIQPRSISENAIPPEDRPRHRLRFIPHGVHICGNPYRRSESSQFHTFYPTNKSVNISKEEVSFRWRCAAGSILRRIRNRDGTVTPATQTAKARSDPHHCALQGRDYFKIAYVFCPQ